MLFYWKEITLQVAQHGIQVAYTFFALQNFAYSSFVLILYLTCIAGIVWRYNLAKAKSSIFKIY